MILFLCFLVAVTLGEIATLLPLFGYGIDAEGGSPSPDLQPRKAGTPARSKPDTSLKEGGPKCHTP